VIKILVSNQTLAELKPFLETIRNGNLTPEGNGSLTEEQLALRKIRRTVGSEAPSGV